MDTNSYKTYSAKPSDIEKKWVLVDAEGHALGRVASKVATLLRGKHKPEFTPHMDTGDNVVVINASKVKLSGKKMKQKEYFSYSGYPGSESFTSAEEMLEHKPEIVIQKAVNGMLPKNKLSNKLMTNMRVYAGPVHEQEAQQPEKIEL
ncbi:LSU ribosomal protein L13P [Fodinibius salinus]|uniref:Large ribosomal subunit protein uL13 n=1 Tax=Fodinibius salinus TaxID=860790 RepID=A0A5D3YKU6_9BACT|nr:50S ribosomal protein L13 [Fodinibius salinus]TYP94115.1 LSU ribosomal protein L13P [Fodinibius salinus]